MRKNFKIHGPLELTPAQHVHLTLKCAAPCDVSVVDRHDLEAEALFDPEGWCVIMVTNVVGVTVTITPEEPLRLVIVPKRQGD